MENLRLICFLLCTTAEQEQNTQAPESEHSGNGLQGGVRRSAQIEYIRDLSFKRIAYQEEKTPARIHQGYFVYCFRPLSRVKSSFLTATQKQVKQGGGTIL